MYRAGYDPQAFVQIFEKLQTLEKRRPGLIAKAFADHPQTPDRIAKSEEEIVTILPARSDYVMTRRSSTRLKHAWRDCKNKRKIDGNKDPNKPSLRRTSACNNADDKKQDSSASPTLGRGE